MSRLRFVLPAALDALAGGGGFFVLAAFWIALGHLFWPSAVFSCVMGLGQMTAKRARELRRAERASLLLAEMPCQFARLDDTHWTVMKFGGEASVVEMPADYDFEEDGPMPLLEKCVDPDLLAALGEQLAEAYEQT